MTSLSEEKDEFIQTYTKSNMRNEGLWAISIKLPYLKNVSMESSGFKIYEDMFFLFANSSGEYQLLTGLISQKEQL